MLIAHLNACTIGGLCSKSLFLDHHIQVMIFTTDRFRVWAFILRTFVPLKLSLFRVRYKDLLSFLYKYLSRMTKIIFEYTAFSSMFIIALFVKIQLVVAMWAYMCVFNSVLLINVICLFLCQCSTIFITLVIKYNLKTGKVLPPPILLLFLVVLTFLILLYFCMKFKILLYFCE